MKRILVLVFIVTLISCEDSNQNNNIKQNVSIEKRDTLERIEENLEAQKPFENAIEFAKFCATQIRMGEANALKPYTNNGILFSPYAFIDTSNARIVGLDELSNPKDKLHYWGIYEGRGDSILLSTSDYLNKFVFNFDINNDDVEIKTYDGKPISRGSEIQNVQDLFPNSTFVEFYESPSKKGYMDWNALIFVVHKKGGNFYLEAIAHNQWTP